MTKYVSSESHRLNLSFLGFWSLKLVSRTRKREKGAKVFSLYSPFEDI